MKTAYTRACLLTVLALFFISSICVASAPPVSGGACAAKSWQCSANASTLFQCDKATWKEIRCDARGALCENNTCVPPWKYGSPKWSRVADDPKATKESLAAKARYYDDIAARLHVHPKLGWIMSATLKCKDASKPCVDPAVPEEKATWRDVDRWHSGENDGLWSALYLASQAYRYAVTKSPDALRMIRLLMEGEATRMRVTGVPGLFTRMYVPPNVPGIECPKETAPYIPDIEKDDNQWVRIGNDGCVQTFDPKSGAFVSSKHCGLNQYAGWCWLDNVSKDEYSGHMAGLGTVVKLVDDPQIRAMANDMLLQIGRHLVQTDMQFTDWDGRIAEHGRLQAFTLEDYPGFNAAMAMSFLKVSAVATQDPELNAWYDRCLLQHPGDVKCSQPFRVIPKPYTSYLKMAGMYVGREGCKSNFNNISMHMLSLDNLIWFETDPEARRRDQNSLDTDVFRAKNQPRAVQYQNNALFDFIWAARKYLGPDSDGPAYAAVENSIRMLRRFPIRKHPTDIQCPANRCIEHCKNRFNGPEGTYPLTIDERCTENFIWWSDPYDMNSCNLNRRVVIMPQDYLLAYWMGRYYGFITKDM